MDFLIDSLFIPNPAIGFLGLTLAGIGWFIWTVVWQSALSLAIGYALNIILSEDPVDNARPGTLENFDFPTTEQGRSIPVLFGSPRMRGYNDVWHGDLGVVAIQEKVKKNSFGNHKNITVGYKYYLGFHYVWCAYAESLIQLRMGEQELIAPVQTANSVSNGTYEYSGYNFTTEHNGYKSVGECSISWSVANTRWEITHSEYGILYYNNYNSVRPPTSSTSAWTVNNATYAPAPTVTTLTRANGYIDIYVQGTGDPLVTSNQNVYISKENIFGGWQSQGGVSGTMSIMFGLPSQPVNPYLNSVLGDVGTVPVPAFRGCVSTVSNNMYVGTTQSLKQMDAIWKRTTKDNRGNDIWYKAKAEIITGSNIAEMNIIHAIHEIIVDPDYSLGFVNGIDETSFQDAADTLYDEGIGVSFVLDVAKNGSSMIQELIGYASGFVRVDNTTNKFQIKLMRDDFLTADLDLVDESIISRVTKITRSVASEVANQVSVTYTDPITRDKATLIAQNTALIEANGVIVNKNVQAPAIHDPTNANVIATRALQTIGTNPFSAEIEGNRSLTAYNLGDPFRFSFPDAGISEAVVRVVDIDYGDLKNGTVKMKVIQDIFKASESIYSIPDESLYESGLEDPTDLTLFKIIELPYWSIVNEIFGASAGSLIDTTAGRPAISGVKTAANSTLFDTMIKESTDLSYRENTQDAVFCPYCEITDSMPVSIDQVIIGYENDIDIDEVIRGENNWCECEGEILKVVNVDTVQALLTLERGCLDTLPVSHSSGSKIYFMSTAYSTGIDEFASGSTVDILMIPSTTLGRLNDYDATPQSIEIDNRYIRPYNGADFKGTGATDFVFTWEHRNRLTQVNEITTQDETGITPETGTTYTFTVKDNGVVAYTETGITGESANYSFAQRTTDFGIGVSGTLSPDATGAYTENGTNDGKPKYDDGTYAIWWDTATSKWYLTVIGSTGTVPADRFESDFFYSDFSAAGTYTGDARVGINDSLATYHLKSVRDGYESWQEWSVSYNGEPQNIVAEGGDQIITESSDNIVTEAF